MPELSLSLNLHLHHCSVGILDVLQRFFNSWKQVNNLLFADQDLAMGRKEHEGHFSRCVWDTKDYSRERVSPEVCVEVFEDLVLVLNCLNDGLHHLGAVSAHIGFGCWWKPNSSS